MFKTKGKGSIITFSRGLYTEFTHYSCEVLGTNVFLIYQYSTNIRQYSSQFATFSHLSPLFVTICDYSWQFITFRDYSSLYLALFVTIRNYSRLFMANSDYSPTIRHYSRLFTIPDYSIFPIRVFQTTYLCPSEKRLYGISLLSLMNLSGTFGQITCECSTAQTWDLEKLFIT